MYLSISFLLEIFRIFLFMCKTIFLSKQKTFASIADLNLMLLFFNGSVYVFKKIIFFSYESLCFVLEFLRKSFGRSFCCGLLRSCSGLKWMFPSDMPKLRTSAIRTDLLCHLEALWGALQCWAPTAALFLLPAHGLGTER